MKKRLYLILLFAILAVFANEAYAASGMGMGPPNPPCGQAPVPPCPVPIDGGLLFLAGAGALIGGRKIYQMKQENPG